MNKELRTEEVENSTNESSQAEKKRSPEGEESEFKVTVRKLEMPVQPRGVLAE